MSKYLDSNNEVDMKKVEEEYLRLSQDATDRAKEDTDHLIHKINYYREHTFEEITANVRESYKPSTDFPENYSLDTIMESCVYQLIQDNNEEISDENEEEMIKEYQSKFMSLSGTERQKIIDKVVEKIEIERCADYFYNNNDEKYFEYGRDEKSTHSYEEFEKICHGAAEKLSKEERRKVLEKEIEQNKKNICAYYLVRKDNYKKDTNYYNRYVDKLSPEELDIIFEECISSEIAEKREIDITYDLLTEEQITNLAKLYYEKQLKKYLAYQKENAIEVAARDLNKKVDHVDYNDLIGRIEDVNNQDEYDRDRVSEIKGGLALLAGIFGFGTIALGSGVNIAELITEGPELMSMSYYGDAAAICLALLLPTVGVLSLKDFFENKKAIQRAKELGLYDVIVDSIKANNELTDYVRELGIEEFAKERGII